MTIGPKLLSIKQVAAELDIATSTIWRLVRSKRFPAPIKIGGSTRWRASDIEALISAAAK